MSEKIKNKKNLIIGIGIIALVAIVIGVATLIKGNNDISGMGKNASFGILGKNGTAFSSITYSHIQNDEYYYNILYFAESNEDAICSLTWHMSYEKPMEKELTYEEEDDYYTEEHVSLDNYTDLKTSISVPIENKDGAPIEKVVVYLTPCDDSYPASYTIYPERDNNNLASPEISVRKDEKQYNDDTAVFEIDSYGSGNDERLLNTIFKNTYYVDGKKLKETFAEENATLSDSISIERTTMPKVLTILSEDTRGNVEEEKVLIQAKDHVGPYCYFENKDKNIKLSIGESKTVTLHCISESGERIDPDRDYDTNDQPVLLYSNNIEVDRLHGIYSGLYDIDEYTQTMKITGNTPGKTTVKFKNKSIADTNSDWLDTNYGGTEYIPMNVEVIDKKDTKAPTCEFTMGDYAYDTKFYVGSKIQYTVTCEDDVKFDASNLTFNTNKISIYNNGEKLTSRFYTNDYSKLPRKVSYSFKVIPVKTGELSVSLDGGFVQDASGRNSKATYITTHNIVEAPKNIKRPSCKIETDKDEITVGESVYATITCTANKKISSTATLGIDVVAPNIDNWYYDNSNTKKHVLTFRVTPSNVGTSEIVLKENAFFNEIDMGNKEVTKEIKVKERIKDTTAPVCKFTSESSKVRTGKTTKVYLTCDDASGFKNTTLPIYKIGVNKIFGISLLRIENVKLIKQTSTSSTWEIGVKGKGLGKAKLYLNENAVSDKFDNKNAKTYATTPIKVTLF